MDTVTMDAVTMDTGRCSHLYGGISQPGLPVVEADQYSPTGFADGITVLHWTCCYHSNWRQEADVSSFTALDDITAAASSAGGQDGGASAPPADAGRGKAPAMVRRWRRLASELASKLASELASGLASVSIRVAAHKCDSVSRRPRPPPPLSR